MKLWTDEEVLRLTNMRAAAKAKTGNPGPEGSIAKLAIALNQQRIYELCMNILGADALVGFDYTFRRPEEISLTAALGEARHMFLRARANSIEGGTSEIMRNILGEAHPRPPRRTASRQRAPLEQGDDREQAFEPATAVLIKCASATNRMSCRRMVDSAWPRGVWGTNKKGAPGRHHGASEIGHQACGRQVSPVATSSCSWSRPLSRNSDSRGSAHSLGGRNPP